MTRKQAHAEAVVMLDQIADIADQAHSLLRSARTDGAVETSRGHLAIGPRLIVLLLGELSYAAHQATCDDCSALVAECRCPWANAETGR